MESFDLKRYAHIGDAVYELFIRENVVFKVKSLNLMHKMTTSFVNANFQAKMAEIIFNNFLNEEEREIFRRARNLNLTINKKIIRVFIVMQQRLRLLSGICIFKIKPGLKNYSRF